MVTVLAVEVWVIGPQIARALQRLGRSDLRWVALAIIAELGSTVAFAALMRRMLSAGGLAVPLPRILGLTYAANAINATLPAGSALSSAYTFRHLRKYGATVPLAGFTLIASGILSTATLAVLALVNGLSFGAGRANHAGLVAGILVTAGVLYGVRRVATDPSFFRCVRSLLFWSDRVLHKPAGRTESAVHEFLRDLREIKPRYRDWADGFAFSAMNWVTDLGCLAASCAAVGIKISLTTVTVAFIAGATLSSLSLLPGGMGVVEAAMIAALTRGGLHIAPAAAAVVLYRLISLVLMGGIGWVAMALSWRRARQPTSFLVGPQAVDLGLTVGTEAQDAGYRQQQRGRRCNYRHSRMNRRSSWNDRSSVPTRCATRTQSLPHRPARLKPLSDGRRGWPAGGTARPASISRARTKPDAS